MELFECDQLNASENPSDTSSLCVAVAAVPTMSNDLYLRQMSRHAIDGISPFMHTKHQLLLAMDTTVCFVCFLIKFTFLTGIGD